MSDTKKKILVGMSGGVDSSAAALILRDQGHEVAGLTFELWDSEDGTCGTKNDVRDAAEVCRVLGIPHFVVDFRKEFRQQVMERFVQDYRHGLTPNPCVDCNRTIKFAAFADKAKELGYETKREKKMKKRYLNIVVFVLLVSMLWGCSDWTKPEAEDFFEMPGNDYYENLRAYKRSEHSVAFGWFGGWTGVGASMVGSLMGLPDSVDFVSIWGNWKNLDEARMLDKKKVKEQKGTRALMCFIVANVGDQLTPEEHKENYKEYWGWKDGDQEAIDGAIRKYANAICDSIDKYGYDGFDIDYEPNYGSPGNLASYPENMLTFVKALGERIGPKSGTGRLLVIDGEPQSIHPETGPYFDYFIVQAYSNLAGNSDANLDRRLAGTIANFKGILPPEKVANMYIVTENFESYAPTGGGDYVDRYGNKMRALAGMARWTPTIDGKQVRKGGVGTYHMEYDYPGDIEYKYLREAIRIMNPAVK